VHVHMAVMGLQNIGSAVGSACCCITCRCVVLCANLAPGPVTSQWDFLHKPAMTPAHACGDPEGTSC
jgi:hypothetical protein